MGQSIEALQKATEAFKRAGKVPAEAIAKEAEDAKINRERQRRETTEAVQRARHPE